MTGSVVEVIAAAVGIHRGKPAKETLVVAGLELLAFAHAGLAFAAVSGAINDALR